MSNDSKETVLAQIIIQVIKERNPKTVKQLASLVKERLPSHEQEILKSILKLESEGKIRLATQLRPTSLKLVTFLRTEQALWFWATIAIAIATAIAVFTIPEDFYPWVYIRYGLGSVFILWLPGYTFMRALFPEKELDSIERFALSLGVSLALVSIVGLLLNYTPFGIQLAPITLSLLALTIILATTAIIRAHKASLKLKYILKVA